jgi:MFS family permease
VAKIALFPVLLIAACVIAGLYGALHDQISYTVSPDYYYGFKFHQFDIPENLQGRIGAAIVGWYASWWMGIFIGVPILIVGLILPGWRMYLKYCLMALAVVAATALLVGLGALVYASLTITETSLPRYWYPGQIADKVAFARAGTMHNFSYLGGFLGIITGSVYLVLVRAHQLRPTKSPIPSGRDPGTSQANSVVE